MNRFCFSNNKYNTPKISDSFTDADSTECLREKDHQKNGKGTF